MQGKALIDKVIIHRPSEIISLGHFSNIGCNLNQVRPLHMHPFVSAWREYRPDPPFVLDGDNALLQDEALLARYDGWQGYIADPDFGRPASPELHLDLFPMPFVGNLKQATVFLLMLNPGLAPSDYFGEYTIAPYRAALEKNLKQEPDCSFLFLDPRHSWHGGYVYWQAKLGKLVAELARRRSCCYGEARQLVQKRLATIELMPYHSSYLKLPARVTSPLKSISLAKQFVAEHLVPRAREGRCLIVATRAKGQWNLPEHRNIIAYTGTEARSAHLSTKTRGGKAILEFLERD